MIANHNVHVGHHCQNAVAPRLCQIHRSHRRANQMRAKMGESQLPYRWSAEKHPGRRDRLTMYWNAVRIVTRYHYRKFLAAPWLHGSWFAAAMCVHHYEGAWNANTGNGYYGGMQFDLGTWASNGGTGRPDLASPAEQLRIAYNTWRSRGWSPWPNTARMCGLL